MDWRFNKILSQEMFSLEFRKASQVSVCQSNGIMICQQVPKLKQMLLSQSLNANPDPNMSELKIQLEKGSYHVHPRVCCQV